MRSNQSPSGALKHTSGPALLDGGHRFGRQARCLATAGLFSFPFLVTKKESLTAGCRYKRPCRKVGRAGARAAWLKGPPLTACGGALPFWHFVPPPPYRGSLSSRGAFHCATNKEQFIVFLPRLWYTCLVYTRKSVLKFVTGVSLFWEEIPYEASLLR